jgi:hypothetical protein
MTNDMEIFELKQRMQYLENFINNIAKQEKSERHWGLEEIMGYYDDIVDRAKKALEDDQT